jgi:nitrous oxidase accessory protein NosD
VQVKENLIWNNSLRGVMVRPSSARQSTRNLIAENVLIENASGVLVFGQPLNVVRENLISKSGRAALHLTGGGASGNLFSENHLTENAAGIEFGPGWVGNTLVENRIEANSCGTTGATDGNTFRENVFTANLVDECP